MTAIFYDVENLQDPSNYKLAINKLQEIYGDLRLSLQFAYADWRRISEQDREVFIQNGAILKQVINGTGYSSSIKNIADITLCVDAMELMSKNGSIDRFVIVSGDGGYISLINKLKEYGKTVDVVAIKEYTNNTLKNYASSLYYINEDAVSSPSEHLLTPVATEERHAVVEENDNAPEGKSIKQEQKQEDVGMYKKATWAIFKSFDDIDELIKRFFHNRHIDERILQDGIHLGQLVRTFEKAKHLSKTSKEQAQFKSKLKQYINKHPFLYLDSSIIKRRKEAELKEKKTKEKLSKKELISIMSDAGISISSTNITQELLQEVFANSDMYFSLSPAEFKKTLYSETKRSKKFIEGVFEILGLLSMNDIQKAINDDYRDVISSKVSMFLSTQLKRKTKKKDILECFEWPEQKTKVIKDKT